MEEKFVFSIEAMGTVLNIKIYEELSEEKKKRIKELVENFTFWFDNTFSRFKKDSLVTKLSKQKGIFNVPYELVEMLKIYKDFSELSGGIINPLIGRTLEDLGYDTDYSLVKKENIYLPKSFDKTIKIIDEQNIELNEYELIDLGALGKGYWVDKVTEILRDQKIADFLVDGSGDIYFSSKSNNITVGLENPFTKDEVLGTINIQNQSICGSATNKRKWADVNHVVNALTGDSAVEIVATWVLTNKAVLADALATILFFMDGDELKEKLKTQNIDFEFLIVYKDKSFSKSLNFKAELFT